MYKHFFKRVFDFLIALVALLLIGWFLIIVAIWLHFANKGAGAFFTQDRPGKAGKIFRVIKFKTMTDERDSEGNLLPDAQRLTKVGRFVRSTSVDELPQLINILKGDMSLIGPRPLLPQYLPLYTPEQARRHEVRPGISGWAQVHGRNHCKLSEKFKLNVWYVDHCNDPEVKVKGQEDAYKTIVTGAVGGAAGVIHAAESAHTDCEPNANVEAMRVALDRAQIEARPVWKPMHKQPVYCRTSEKGIVNSEKLPSGAECLTYDTSVAYVNGGE